MAQTTFEKTMRNVSLSDKPRERTPRNLRKSWQFTVDIDPSEQTKLKAFMKHELEYYNILVNGLAARMRTMPDVLLSADENVIRLYLACAESSFDPYKISLMRNVNFAKGEEPQLPVLLEPHRNLLFGVNSNGERRFTDRLALMCQMFAQAAPIHPKVRRGMVEEMIQFYKTQTKASMQAVPSHLQAEQIFKTAPQSLEVHDIIKKRHLQLPKSVVKVTWDEENDCTFIKTPYTSQGIKIPSINFVDGITGWNYIILHQSPGGIALTKTPWVVDIRSIQGSYLLKYTDVRTSHAGAAFHQAKRGVGARI